MTQEPPRDLDPLIDAQVDKLADLYARGAPFPDHQRWVIDVELGSVIRYTYVDGHVYTETVRATRFETTPMVQRRYHDRRRLDRHAEANATLAGLFRRVFMHGA